MISSLLRKSVQLVPWRYRQRVKDWPALGAMQRWVVARFLSRAPFLHTINAGPANGLRVWIQLPEDKGMWTGAYEPEFAGALAAAVRPGDVCFDIGGYRGFFAGVFAIAGASAVHIFEPLPANIARIDALIESNPNLPLHLHRIALGAEPGQATFVVMPESSMGKLSTSSFQNEAPKGEAIPVTIESLDHLREAGLIPSPRLMKIDVEGAEAMVLRGAERTLRAIYPQLFVEIHSRALARECDELLRKAGYDVQVMETGVAPDFVKEPEVCHFVVVHPSRPR